jgi:hypothetical protein
MFQLRTQEFFFGGGGGEGWLRQEFIQGDQQTQFMTEDREKEDLGAVAPK